MNQNKGIYITVPLPDFVNDSLINRVKVVK